MKSHGRTIVGVSLAMLMIGALGLTGCSRERNAPTGATTSPNALSEALESRDSGAVPPSGIVTITVAGRPVRIWPYTGAGFDGQRIDPINLVFAGKANPVRVRAALVGLNGDRTAFGFPDAYPFNATWSDAQGDAQTGWSASERWTGSVIQLQLGDYQPVRVHLRLFRAGSACRPGADLTLGAAHFEVLIPGTADHQVLSWELAQQLVMVDVLRSGILGAGGSVGSTGPINDAPAFRTIPAVIYNGLPPELIAAIGGPPAPVAADVPIPSDGEGTLFEIMGSVPVIPGTFTNSITLTYGQLIPKPICATGPLDYVYVTGPVTFNWVTRIDRFGLALVQSRYSGQLTITPMDVTVTPPVPNGAPYPAEVSEMQTGFLGARASELLALTKRLAREPDGVEYRYVDLKVGGLGCNRYIVRSSCLTPAS